MKIPVDSPGNAEPQLGRVLKGGAPAANPQNLYTGKALPSWGSAFPGRAFPRRDFSGDAYFRKSPDQGANMQIYNIHDAETHLSRLVEQAAKGESFIIAKAGKPMVKVIPLDASEPSRTGRFGFMAGQISVPDDFDRMGEWENSGFYECKEKEMPT